MNPKKVTDLRVVAGIRLQPLNVNCALWPVPPTFSFPPSHHIPDKRNYPLK
jgi:hypothetical protein